MKLKHWQGYGTVNAKKISSEKVGENICLTVEVTGVHECGLVCNNDNYTLHRWLVSRFAKDCPDYKSIRHIKIISDDEVDDTKAVYEITYCPSEEK